MGMQTETITVKKGAKLLSTLDVNGHATFGSATIKGKLYVGKRAIGDIVTSMEQDMAKMRSEMAETKQMLQQALMMLKQRAPQLHRGSGLPQDRRRLLQTNR